MNLVAALAIGLFGCAAFSEGGKDPELGEEIDMAKNARFFDVKIGDRFRSKVDFVYSNIPGSERRIRDARVGGVGKGEVVVKPGMEVTLLRVERGPFGPSVRVAVSKPFIQERATPLIGFFRLRTDDGRYLLDGELFERIP